MSRPAWRDGDSRARSQGCAKWECQGQRKTSWVKAQLYKGMRLPCGSLWDDGHHVSGAHPADSAGDVG